MQQPGRATRSSRDRDGSGPEGTARTLGWLGIGLGAVALARPGRLVGLAGGRRRGVTRLYGVREIVTGIGILNARDPTPWLWGRVAGDVLDMLSLVKGFGRSPRKARRLLTLMSVLGVTAVDVATARRMGQRELQGPPSEFSARRSMTMHGSPAALLAKWGDPAVLAQVMAFLADLDAGEDGRTRWTVRLPPGGDTPGGTLSWDMTAETHADRIVWTRAGSGLPVTGEVRTVSATLPDQTEVILTLRFGPADGLLGRRLVQMFQPLPVRLTVDKALERFRDLAGSPDARSGAPTG